MARRTGMSMSINSVVLVAIGLVVLGATGVLVGTSQADVADTSDQVASDSQCDTWAEQSTTAGNPDEADNAEQQYNENCEGKLDDISDSNGFISGEGYDRDENQDGGLVGGLNPDITPSTQVSGSYNLVEGDAQTIDDSTECGYIGRDTGSNLNRAYVACDSNIDSPSGLATGPSNGCRGQVVSGIPVSQGNGNSGTTLKGDCLHSGIIQTADGEKKLALCEYVESSDQSTGSGSVETIRIAIGEPNAPSAQICG